MEVVVFLEAAIMTRTVAQGLFAMNRAPQDVPEATTTAHGWMEGKPRTTINIANQNAGVTNVRSRTTMPIVPASKKIPSASCHS